MLKTRQISLFFKDMQDNVEKVLELLQTLGRTAIPFIKKYIVQAAKRIGTDLFEIAAPEIGEVVCGRKTLKTFAKDVGTKTVRKELRGGKKKSKCRKKEEPFLEK